DHGHRNLGQRREIFAGAASEAVPAQVQALRGHHEPGVGLGELERQSGVDSRRGAPLGGCFSVHIILPLFVLFPGARGRCAPGAIRLSSSSRPGTSMRAMATRSLSPRLKRRGPLPPLSPPPPPPPPQP